MDFYSAVGVRGITILGMMGEAAKLDAQESLDFAKHVIRRAGTLPVIVGVAATGFAAMRTLARGVVDLGAAAVMIAPPPTCRTDDQIVTFYRQASEAMGADIPFVIQHYPLASDVILSTDVIEQIITNDAARVMLKAEDRPGLEKISALRRSEKEGRLRRVPILCGNGGLFLEFELTRGADGAMTGYAFTELLVQMRVLKTSGDHKKMHDLFDAHFPLIRYEQQPGAGLGVRKYILMCRGLLASDAQRAPRAALSPEARREIDMLLNRVLCRDASLRLNAT